MTLPVELMLTPDHVTQGDQQEDVDAQREDCSELGVHEREDLADEDLGEKRKGEYVVCAQTIVPAEPIGPDDHQAHGYHCDRDARDLCDQEMVEVIRDAALGHA